MNRKLTDLYQHKAEETSKTLVSLRNRSRVFILTEIGSFLVAIGFVVLYTLLDNAAWTLFCALAALLFYLYIRRRDVLNDRKDKERGGFIAGLSKRDSLSERRLLRL